MKNLEDVLKMIYERSPIQKKRIENLLLKMDRCFFQEADRFVMDYAGYLASQGLPLEFAVEAYLGFCSDTMQCQIDFAKTGKYAKASPADIFENVYNNDKKMKSYMVGLAISQFLWESHYRIYNFFAEYMKVHGAQVGSYLEVGPGHGLFLDKALGYLGPSARIDVVDISPASINITRSMVDYFRPSRKVEYHTADIFKFTPEKSWDFITAGEVLEHVHFPKDLLARLRMLLGREGSIFLSTCVNAPEIDHVYQFETVQQIRDMVTACGFAIKSELVLPVKDFPMEEIEKKKVAVNYCAILK